MSPETLGIDELVDYAPAECQVGEFQLYWQMTRAERFCLIHLLQALKPAVSVEVGTHKGGSLQVLSRYSEAVYSIDIDPLVAHDLQGLFPNVTYKCGDSSTVLPQVIAEINESTQKLGLVLIDGDHSERGVKRDIESALALVPRNPVCIVVHDSFHPPCRRGIRSADWAACKYVHYVEVDFVGGIFLPGRSQAEHSMYGGFALALLLPEERKSSVRILESQPQHFDIVSRFAQSSEFAAYTGRQSLGARLKSAVSRLRGSRHPNSKG